MPLQGETMYETDTRHYNYKYLVLPVTSNGINARQYFKNIRQKFYITLNEALTGSEANQSNAFNKLTLHKTVIQAHFDYGAPVIHYTD